MKKITMYFATMALFVAITPFVLAENKASGQGPEGAGGGQGSQLQDRDRIQDPTTTQGDEPLQVRTQDRDRVQDPENSVSGEPLQVRTQDRERVQDQATPKNDEPIQARDRERDWQTEPEGRAQNSDELRSMIQEQHRKLTEVTAGGDAQNQEIAQNQNRMRESVHAILAGEMLLGNRGPEVSELARQIADRVQTMTQSEESIQKRSRITRMFFGGDRDAANELAQNQEQVRTRTEEMKQLLNTCEGCDEGARQVLQEQIQTMEQEQTRLEQVAQKELGTRGVFGFLFGWMRN